MHPGEAGLLPWQWVEALCSSCSWLFPFPAGQCSQLRPHHYQTSKLWAGWVWVISQRGSHLVPPLQRRSRSWCHLCLQRDGGVQRAGDVMEIQFLSQCTARLCQPHPPGYRLCCSWENKGGELSLKIKEERSQERFSSSDLVLINF